MVTYIDKKGNLIKGGIYIITNLFNNKNYIGSTRLFTQRLSHHFTYLKKNKHHSIHMQRAYNKTPHLFEWNIIELCDKKDLLIREKYWIDYFNSSNRLYGYNIRKDPQTNIGYKVKDEIKQKISKSMLGKKQSEEHKKKQCEARRGRKNNSQQLIKMSISTLSTPIETLKAAKIFMDKNPKKMNLTLNTFGISKRQYMKILRKEGYFFLYE